MNAHSIGPDSHSIWTCCQLPTRFRAYCRALGNYRSLPLGRGVGYLESRMGEAGPTATFWLEARRTGHDLGWREWASTKRWRGNPPLQEGCTSPSGALCRQVHYFRVRRDSGTNAMEVLGFLVLKDRFTLGKPRRAERDYGEGLKPKYWSKPLNKGFDWW